MIPISMIIFHVSTTIDRHGAALITLLTYVGYVNFFAIPQGITLGGNNALTAASIIYPMISLTLYLIKAKDLRTAKGIFLRYHVGNRVLTPAEELTIKMCDRSMVNYWVCFSCMTLSFLQLGVLLLPNGG